MRDLSINSSTPEISPAGTAYRFLGNTSSSHPLVFIHGVGLNHRVWQAQIDFFYPDYPVLVYDMLGHGDSRPPSAEPELVDFSQQLEQLLQYLDIGDAHIIGHSMGALIAVAYALEFGSRVHTLIPMNIVYQRTTAQRQLVMQRAQDVIDSGQIIGIEQALQRWFPRPVEESSQQKIDQLREWMEQLDPYFYGLIYRLFAKSDCAFCGRLNQLDMLTLYLGAENDINSTPEMSQQMAAQTPQGSATIIPQAAHMMAYRNPELVNPLIRNFIQSHQR